MAQADLAGSDEILVRFGLPQGRSLPDGIAELGRVLPGVTADRNDIYTPDDFLCHGIDCDAHALIAWPEWSGERHPQLGMIDTGVNTDHPALAGWRLTLHRIDLSARDAAGRQLGTAIVAILVGNDAGRIPGLRCDAALVAVEAFHKRGVTEQGVDVINMSFSGPENRALERLVEHAFGTGIGLVAAVGDGGPGAPPAYPAAWPQVIGVIAVDSRERIYKQAIQSPYVALAVPGGNLWTEASVSGGRLRPGSHMRCPL